MSRLLTLAVIVAFAAAACSTSSTPPEETVAAPGSTTVTSTDPSATEPPGVTSTLPADTSVPPATSVSPSTTRGPQSGTGDGGPDTPVLVTGDAVTGPGSYRRVMAIAGIEREYVLHIPDQAWDTTEVALVIDLHGLGSTPESQDDLSGFLAKAQEIGFALAQPQAAGVIPTWQAGVTPSPDVEFLRVMISDVSSHLALDAVFAVGFSNGGGMTHRLACDAPEELAAIASVAGAYPDTGPCTGSVPVLAFHGTRDPVVPFRGAGVLLPDVTEWASSWADRAGCTDVSTTSVADDVRVAVWEGCDPGLAVELYAVVGGGHGWPGTTSRSRFFDSTGTISATDIIWDFFEAHR